MRIITKLAMLAIIGGVASCGGIASEPVLDPMPESTPLKLLSAKRFSGGWNPSHSEGGVEIPREWFIRSAWKANPAALSPLERALLNRPWVSITEFKLDGGKVHSGRYSQGRQWIDCTFSNGKELRVFFRSGSSSKIVDGWHSSDGRYGYRLGISYTECCEILDLSKWDKLERSEVVDEPPPGNDESLSHLLTHPGAVFKSNLGHDSEVEPASVLVATRSIFNLEGAGDGSAQDNQVVVQAQGDTLRCLEEAVQGKRWSTLRFTMDGEVNIVERDEEPSERIVCQMSDGQAIEILVYSSDKAWCVIGEGSFRLALSEGSARKLLDPSGWKVSD